MGKVKVEWEGRYETYMKRLIHRSWTAVRTERISESWIAVMKATSMAVMLTVI